MAARLRFFLYRNSAVPDSLTVKQICFRFPVLSFRKQVYGNMQMNSVQYSALNPVHYHKPCSGLTFLLMDYPADYTDQFRQLWISVHNFALPHGQLLYLSGLFLPADLPLPPEGTLALIQERTVLSLLSEAAALFCQLPFALL